MSLFPKKQETLNTKQEQDEHPLSKEKSFEEHMTELTKNTHETNPENYDKQLVSEIDKLEGSDRNLVLAQLRHGYEDNGSKQWKKEPTPIALALEYVKQDNKSLDAFFSMKSLEIENNYYSSRNELSELDDEQRHNEYWNVRNKLFQLDQLHLDFARCQYAEKVNEAINDAALSDEIIKFCKRYTIRLPREAYSTAYIANGFKNYNDDNGSRPSYYQGILKLLAKDAIEHPLSNSDFGKSVQEKELSRLSKVYSLEKSPDDILFYELARYNFSRRPWAGEKSWLQGINEGIEEHGQDFLKKPAATNGDLVDLAIASEVRDEILTRASICKENSENVEQGEKILAALKEKINQ